jgi:hypothetical protein
VTGCSARAKILWTTLSTVLILQPMISIRSDIMQNTWLDVSLGKMLILSTFLFPGYRHLMHIYVVQWDKHFSVTGDYVIGGYVLSGTRTMYVCVCVHIHTHIYQRQNGILGIRTFVTCLFKTPL